MDDGSLHYGAGESGEVVAHVENTAVVRMSYGLGCFTSRYLRQIRTKEQRVRDELADIISENYEMNDYQLAEVIIKHYPKLLDD